MSAKTREQRTLHGRPFHGRFFIMNRKKLMIFVFFVLLLGLCSFVLSLGWGQQQKATKEKVSQDTSAQTQGTNGKKGPTKAAEAPSPSEQTGGKTPGVEIPTEKQQQFGIKTVEVSMKDFQRTIRAVGRIDYDERKLATVNLKTEGWIERLYVDSTWRPVKKDEPLAEVYSPEVVAVQLEYLNLLKWKTEKSHRFQRNLEFTWGDRYGTTGRMLTFDLEALIAVAHQRLNLWDFTEKQIKEIEESGKPRRTYTLRSPISGYVIQKPVVQGTRVEPGGKIYDIADISTLYVIADVFAYELPLIKANQEATLRVSHFPGKELRSKIELVYPSLSAETRTARVRFTIPNPDHQLKPQMFTNVEMKVDLGKRLAIPEDAVIDTGTRQVVYVDKGDGYFEPRAVQIGVKADDRVEVLKGLKAGEKVASSANFLIDSEAKLKGVLQ